MDWAWRDVSFSPGELRNVQRCLLLQEFATPGSVSAMINDDVKSMLQAANFAAFTTLFADGQPQTNIMWVDCDDEFVYINTEVHREKYKNVKNDPRVTLAVFDNANPYHYAEIRGRVVNTEAGDKARAHIDTLSQKYVGKPYGPPIQSERVILKITADRQRVQ